MATENEQANPCPYRERLALSLPCPLEAERDAMRAVMADSLQAAGEILMPYFGESPEAEPKPCGVGTWSTTLTTFASRVVRPAPPDLAEWLDAEHDKWIKIGKDTCAYRMVTPGGWLYAASTPPTQHSPESAPALAFVPVAGAAGITVAGGAK